MFDIKPLDSQLNSNEKPSNIPKHPFSILTVGQKSAGKSTLIINLLTKTEFYKGKFNVIYYVSPTASCDIKTKELLLKTSNILKPNLELKKAMKRVNQNSMLASPKSEVNIDKNMTESNFFDEISEEWISELVKHQKMIIQKYGKDLSNKVLLVLDDSIGKKIIHSASMRNLVLNSRHINLSIVFSSQHYKLLPLALRNNTSFLVLFEISNLDNLKAIYAEADAGISSFKDWLKIYREIVTEKQFNFMSINFQNRPKFRIQNGFNEVYQLI